MTGLNHPETVVTLYALFEQRAPVLLLHPRLTAMERAAKTQAAGRHDLSGLPDAAAILFTSGTTGRPRGAVLTRSALVASAQASAANLGWVDGDCWLLPRPSGASAACRSSRAVWRHQTVALEAAFNAATLPTRLEDTRNTPASLVPTMLAQTLDAHPRWTAPAHLRAILAGGSGLAGRTAATGGPASTADRHHLMAARRRAHRSSRPRTRSASTRPRAPPVVHCRVPNCASRQVTSRCAGRC